MNTRALSLILLIFILSCEKEEIPKTEYSQEISFEVSGFEPKQNAVFDIELISEGYYYSGFYEKRIYYSTWGGDTSSFKTNSEVRKLVFDKRFHRLYFGTKSSGIGLIDNKKVQYFNTKNSTFPRDGANIMDVDSEGNLWVSASYNGEGGLYKFDGIEFTHFSTNNSPLKSDLITGICCDNAVIYISGKGVDGRTVFRIEKNDNDEYEWKDLLCDGNYYHDIELDINGNIYIICRIPAQSIVQLSNDGIVEEITPEKEGKEYVYTQLKTDKRGYLWVSKIDLKGSEQLSVYDGIKWHQAPDGFPDGGLESIDVDENNNIWLATEKGIYILSQ